MAVFTIILDLSVYWNKHMTWHSGAISGPWVSISGPRNSKNGSAIFLETETDKMVQFLAPETDILGERINIYNRRVNIVGKGDEVPPSSTKMPIHGWLPQIIYFSNLKNIHPQMCRVLHITAQCYTDVLCLVHRKILSRSTQPYTDILSLFENVYMNYLKLYSYLPFSWWMN